ncbi:MAG: hypothetical protein HOQ36_23180 [Nocardia sp.]|nr:hypothetical protein [Nocardia sp.]NUS95280.1 hypothetical protein [Nocardia sp.]
MSGKVPTVVAVYELVATGYERVAEFRLTAAGTITLTSARPEGCPTAQEWYTDGIPVPESREPVTVADGPAFLRAALRPRRTSYCRVVDESPDAAPPPVHREPRSGPRRGDREPRRGADR